MKWRAGIYTLKPRLGPGDVHSEGGNGDVECVQNVCMGAATRSCEQDGVICDSAYVRSEKEASSDGDSLTNGRVT